jgi:hypothetical protein
MKLALKYGILVTLAIAAWVALKHFTLHPEPRTAQLADIAVFNLAAITGLAMGIREKRTLWSVINGARTSCPPAC